MFYKPKFCCECGEKVERNNWKPWTNRRFCENCETEQQASVWLPRIGLLAALVFGLFGVGSFLQKTEKPLTVTSAQTSAAKNTESNQKNLPNANVKFLAQSENPVANAAASPEKKQTSNDPKSLANTPFQLRENSAERQTGETEAVYFCGAQTKKGTPCSRRVKGGGRCWQHAGQPALLPPEKLLISR